MVSDPHAGKKAAVKSAERSLCALLRKPRTREGLVAAVKGPGVTQNFVFGWLTEQVRTGVVTKLRSTEMVMYQVSSYVVVETPAVGTYPSWLEPRCLPEFRDRGVFLDGKPVGAKTTIKEG